MPKGAIAATATASELVPADGHRGEVILQHISGNKVFLEFGDGTPVVDQGLVLSSSFPVIKVDDSRAGQAIKGICATGETAVGTYVTD
jgi:hypothetical protein